MDDRPGRLDIEGAAPNEAIALFEMDADAWFDRDHRLSVDSSLGMEEEEETPRPPAAGSRT